MFVLNEDLSIYVTRGDVVFFTVTAEDEGTPYIFQPGDVVRMKVYGKKNAENVVLQKDFPVTDATENVYIYLEEKDTKIGDVISKPTDYWYEVELNPFTNPQTIIGYDDDGAKIFKLYPEGRDLNDDPVEPEDIPVVDTELNPASTRPVENQAIARAVVQLQAAIESTDRTANAKANETAEALTAMGEDVSTKTASLEAEVAVERARIDNLLSGATPDGAEVTDIRVGADGVNYGNAGTAVREQVTAVKRAATRGNKGFEHISFETSQLVITDGVVKKKASEYRCVSKELVHYDRDIEINIADGYRFAMYFCDGNFNFLSGGEWHTNSVTIPANSLFYLMVSLAGGDQKTALTTSEIAEYECAVSIRTAMHDAIEEVKASVKNLDDAHSLSQSDVKYVQNPNLYDGKWTVGRYVYEDGSVFDGESDHARNLNVIQLDATKGYNIARHSDYATLGTLYLYKYDENMEFLEVVYVNEGVVHFSGVSFVNFSIGGYTVNYPGENPHVMLWESEDATKTYTEWLEYGEQGDYFRTKLQIGEWQAKYALLSEHKARFDSSFNYVAYSSVYKSVGAINTAEHYAWCAKQGFTSLKGDVQPTSDGKIIMCHDSGFTLDGNGRISTYDSANATAIHDMTEEQCLALQHANGNHVCNFDAFIKICKKYGKIAYITIRDKFVDEFVDTMLQTLDKYNMRTRCIVNSFTLSSLQTVRAADDTIMLSQVLPTSETISTKHIDNAVNLGNCMICGFDFPRFGTFDALSEDVLRYARQKDIRLYEAQVDSMEDVDKLIEFGIAGAHMTVVPEF